MVVVAIAGGTSPTLGKSLVTAILATGKHEVIILSRKPEDEDQALPTTKYGAPIRYVDYTSIPSLTTSLTTTKTHTLLSVLKTTDPNTTSTLHSNLLLAAIASGTVRRFAPSDWSMGPLTHQSVEILSHKTNLLHDAQRTAAEAKADIEVCTFQNGMFMEYLAQGLSDPGGEYVSQDNHQPDPVSDSTPGMETRPRTRSEVLLSGLTDDLMLSYIDIPASTLPIPLTSTNHPATITTISIPDIGRFVAAALDLENGTWEGYMGIVGSNITFAEVKDILRTTNAPEIRDAVITRVECEEKAARFDEVLKKGFSLEALLGKMVVQMMGAACGGKLGEGVVDGKVNRLLEERGMGVKGRDVGVYLREVWGEKGEDGKE